MKQWYVLKSLFAQEKRAEAHLLNQGVECYLPLFTCQLVAGGKVKPVKPQPLFPGYLFARFDPEEVHTTTIKATRGVSTIVSFGNRIAVMGDAEMERIRQGAESAAQADMRAPEHGDTVLITNGTFEDMEAIWHEPRGAKRAMLLLNLMGRLVELDLKKVRSQGIQFRRISNQGHAAA